MPYVHIVSNVDFTNEDKINIKDYIAEIMPIIPGKSINNTMIQIDSAYLFFKEADKPAALVELRTYKNSPLECKQEFVNKVCEFLKEKYNIDKDYMYFNFMEMDIWGANGLIK